jgi:FlaA1/EpsC-like NDP-sugar epimerase
VALTQKQKVTDAFPAWPPDFANPGRSAARALHPFWLGLSRTLDEIASHRALRRWVLAALEVVLAVTAVVAAAAIVYSGEFWHWPLRLYSAAAILVATKLLAGVITGAFDGRWRYVGLRDAMTIVRSALIAGGAGLILIHWLQLVNTSLRLVAADTSIYVLLCCGLRLSTRWLHEWSRRASATSRAALRRVVVVGAGESGAVLIKSMLWSPKLLMEPVAVVDDNPNKQGSRLHGAPIVGSVAELAGIVEKYQADEIVIAIPSATADQIGRVVDACVATRVPFRIAPDPEDVLSGRSGPSRLRDVQPSDLLGRAPVDLWLGELRAEFRGARIVITGAAGSIGSELVRQLVKLEPAILYLIDRNENDLYFLCEELDRRAVKAPLVEVIQDVRDQRRMTRICQEIRPTHVFHAAAFKHVPLMEFHLGEAVENNILGTWTTLEAARAAGASKFVLISTDKAVRPSSIMGATKRFAELLVAEATRENGMKGVIVRFGNVLGSNGSVVPLFQRQIAAGGPVTVTDREATRYFMTTPEAAQLVLQSVAMPESAGKVALLDMGTPVRIWDLAERLIRMSGLRPGADIEIVETGLRPGEKLHEELWWNSGNARPSSHPQIMLGEVGEPIGETRSLIPLIRELVEKDDAIVLHQLLVERVGLTNGVHGVMRYERPRRPPKAQRTSGQQAVSGF